MPTLKILDEQNKIIFETTASELFDYPEARVLPFKCLKEQLYNHEDIKNFFEKELNWKITFYNKTPLNIQNEIKQIHRFRIMGQKPGLKSSLIDMLTREKSEMSPRTRVLVTNALEEAVGSL